MFLTHFTPGNTHLTDTLLPHLNLCWALWDIRQAGVGWAGPSGLPLQALTRAENPKEPSHPRVAVLSSKASGPEGPSALGRQLDPLPDLPEFTSPRSSQEDRGRDKQQCHEGKGGVLGSPSHMEFGPRVKDLQLRGWDRGLGR